MLNPYRIDVHHHILPPEYLTSLKSVGIKTAIGEPFPKWNSEISLGVMDKYGIQSAIVSISAPGIYFGNPIFTKNLARYCNEFSANLIRTFPQRFGAFAVLPLPDVRASLIELEYALDTLNLDGVVLLTNIDGIYLGDNKYNDLFYELNRRKTVIFIHPNAPPINRVPMTSFRPTILEFVFDTTRAVANLIHSGSLKRYPEIKFILSHAGGTVPFLTWRISFGKKKLIRYLKNFYYDIALSSTRYVFRSLQELVSYSQILFGSDFPFAPEPVTASIIEGFQNYDGFDTKARKAIAQDNAYLLFPRLKQH